MSFVVDIRGLGVLIGEIDWCFWCVQREIKAREKEVGSWTAQNHRGQRKEKKMDILGRSAGLQEIEGVCLINGGHTMVSCLFVVSCNFHRVRKKKHLVEKSVLFVGGRERGFDEIILDVVGLPPISHDPSLFSMAFV